MKFPYPPAYPFRQETTLSFYPSVSDNSLRPWDGADEYLLEVLSRDFPEGKIPRPLILGDSCGALTVPLAGYDPIGLNDSCGSRYCITGNLRDNGYEGDPVFHEFHGDFPAEAGLILLKIPKSLPRFRYELERLRERITNPVTILAAGMAKLLPPSFFETFQELTDGGEYSLIKRKARYYRGVLTPVKVESREEHRFSWEGKELISLPGVFSYGKPDRGTLFLLDRFPRIPAPATVVDPGCGCGILGIQAALTWPEAKIIATDDSAAAVESTRLSARENGVEDRFDIRHTHILEGVDDDSADLVLCNPPFHQQHRIQLETGFAFITESLRVLKSGGWLFLVANRYLGYEKELTRQFSKMKILGQDKKFRLYMCRK